MIDNASKSEIYEHIIIANRQFSKWTSRVVFIGQVLNPTLANKPRLTFAYHHVKKQLPSVYMELSARIHDSLGNLYYSYLFPTNLKYVYFEILLHPDDKRIFTFII